MIDFALDDDTTLISIDFESGETNINNSLFQFATLTNSFGIIWVLFAAIDLALVADFCWAKFVLL